jgi:hypothetical protein
VREGEGSQDGASASENVRLSPPKVGGMGAIAMEGVGGAKAAVDRGEVYFFVCIRRQPYLEVYLLPARKNYAKRNPETRCGN